MAKVVVMPKMGLTMEDGTITAWHKQVGDAVKVEDPLFEVETEKITNTVEADTEGILRKIIVDVDGVANCGDPVAIIAGADEDISGLI